MNRVRLARGRHRSAWVRFFMPNSIRKVHADQCFTIGRRMPVSNYLGARTDSTEAQSATSLRRVAILVD
jgi:hypothetical protein